MQDVVCELAEAMRSAATARARLEAFGRHVANFGISRFTYVNTSPRFHPFCMESTYPREWVDHYVARGYQDCDVVAIEAQRAIMPFRWRPLLSRPQVGPLARRVFDEAEAFGIRDGLTVPIRGADGYAMMSMVADDPAMAAEDALPVRHALHLMSFYYHDAVERAAEAARAPVSLTPREREVLVWTARGKTSWEISQILKLSERTVNFHIEKAKAKLDVNSRSHATVKAIMLGLISP